jgi:hypothetical protein
MRLLIVTTGSTQLLYQLACIENLKFDEFKIDVIYNGLYRKSLEIFFKQLSNAKNYNFVDTLNFQIYPFKSKFGHSWFNQVSKLKLNKLIKKNYGLLRQFRNYEVLLIPVRVKMESDIPLITYLNPDQIFLTADGVFDDFPTRDLSQNDYSYLDDTLKKFPIKRRIYSPSYLKTDIVKIGNYVEINCNDIFKSVEQIALAKNFRKSYLDQKISCVILSQHFHLHENISYEDDINYYSSLIEHCLKKYDNKILFKPHPRDTQQKIAQLDELFGNKINIISEVYQSLPIEVFYTYFGKMNTVFFTGNSSAILFFKDKNETFSIKSSKYFNNSLNEKIKLFSEKYNIELIDL